MNFRILLIACFALFATTTKAQDKITYDTGHVLEWKDFKGKVPKASTYHALTNSGISFATSTIADGDSLEIKVLCYFDPDKSWTKKDKQQQNLLNHERLHWDITELYARQLRQALAKSSIKFEDLSKELGMLFNEYVSEQDKRQVAYDKETDHSKNEEQQKQWEATIAKELKSLEAWSAPAIRIALNR